MKKQWCHRFASMVLAVSLGACGTVPITGRRSFSLVSDSEILSSSLSQYSGFVSQARSQGLLTSDARVTEVARRLIAATNSYLREHNQTGLLSQMNWEVNVVNSPEVNAFCMPGGKIVVYTGLTKLIGNGTGSDAELAAVLGHEIGHALAKHANERMSNAMLTQMGGQILGATVGSRGGVLGDLFNTAYGLGTNVFVALPFGRKQELEADKMGLVLMAIAGYDPHNALNLWVKMAKASGGVKSELLSTHPTEERRIEEIQKYLPEALKYYRPATTVVKPVSNQGSKVSKTTRKR